MRMVGYGRVSTDHEEQRDSQIGRASCREKV